MTPNLEKLFCKSTPRPWCNAGRYLSGGDAESVAEFDTYTDAQLTELLANHGQAMIEAIEAILVADAGGRGLSLHQSMQRADQLLATLEREANGQP